MSAVATIGFVGNCQAELLSRALAKAARGLRVLYQFYDVQGEEAVDVARRSDILILQDIHDVEDWARRAAIPPTARVVRIPFLRFAAPWPYDDFNGLRDAHARAQDDAALHTVTYYDSVLARLRRSVPDPAARLDAFLRLDLPQLLDPLRVLDFEARRLTAMDEAYGIAIGAHVIQHFRDRQLFYTVNRPGAHLLRMVLALIARDAGLELESDGVDLDELRSIECPVHPRVAECLGLVWATPDRRYARNGSAYTFEEHARDYIARYG